MLKKFTYILTALFILTGLFAAATPASALGSSRLLKGTIVAINTKTRLITVAPLRGAPVKIKVGTGAAITRKGKISNFTKLRVGDKVNMTYDTGTKQAGKIDDTPSLYEIHGTVEAVDTTASTLTVASEEGGNSVILKVDSTTVIQRNGAAATLADLVVGEKVEAKYNSTTMLASLVKTETEDGEVHGAIAALDLAGNTVTITPNDGSADIVLTVTESTVFINNDTVIAFGDLKLGDNVEANYDLSTLVASKVEVDD